MISNYFIVAAGAAIGGTFRYWLSDYTYKFFPITFPYGTLIVNILGSFLLGIIIFFLDGKELISSSVRLFLTIGFCGGFTTFSTFSLETINLLREGQLLPALMNILLNVILCLAAIYLASVVSKI